MPPSRQGRGFWVPDTEANPDDEALAEFARSIQPIHERNRRRNQVYPAARIYEFNYIREQIQRSRAASAAAKKRASVNATEREPLETEREQEYWGRCTREIVAGGHLEAQREGVATAQSEGGSVSESGTGSEGEDSFATAPESLHSEEERQTSERVDGHLLADFTHLSIADSHPQPQVEIPIVVVTDHDSDDFSIILTPSSHSSMDEDFLEEDGEVFAAQHHANEYDHEDDFVVPSDDEDEDMGESDVEDGFGDSDGEVVEDDELDPDAAPAVPFNPVAMGLKEIGGLARFRVSSYKPGNGVEELINDDTDRYWQSDGIQPHRLTMTFVKRVEIRALRFYVDYTQDESYTPTRINWLAGTSEHDLHAFGTSSLVNPSGWTDVPLTGAGGGEDGNSLFAWVVQMQIVENHQNGKDTHIRGVKVYGFDDQLRAAGATGVAGRDDGSKEFRVDEAKDAEENEKALRDHLRAVEFTRSFQDGDPSGTASSLDFMEDPIIR